VRRFYRVGLFLIEGELLDELQNDGNICMEGSICIPLRKYLGNYLLVLPDE
jgi:hypothetical protein